MDAHKLFTNERTQKTQPRQENSHANGYNRLDTIAGCCASGYTWVMLYVIWITYKCGLHTFSMKTECGTVNNKQHLTKLYCGYQLDGQPQMLRQLRPFRTVINCLWMLWQDFPLFSDPTIRFAIVGRSHIKHQVADVAKSLCPEKLLCETLLLTVSFISQGLQRLQWSFFSLLKLIENIHEKYQWQKGNEPNAIAFSDIAV